MLDKYKFVCIFESETKTEKTMENATQNTKIEFDQKEWFSTTMGMAQFADSQAVELREKQKKAAGSCPASHFVARRLAEAAEEYARSIRELELEAFGVRSAKNE